MGSKCCVVSKAILQVRYFSCPSALPIWKLKYPLAHWEHPEVLISIPLFQYNNMLSCILAAAEQRIVLVFAYTILCCWLIDCYFRKCFPTPRGRHVRKESSKRRNKLIFLSLLFWMATMTWEMVWSYIAPSIQKDPKAQTNTTQGLKLKVPLAYVAEWWHITISFWHCKTCN